MGQVCPASAPSQHYAPTNCQGVSTNIVTNEKSNIETSQPCMESRLISRGASCTQDDIRRSLRKEKDSPKATNSPRSTHNFEGNKDDEHLHSKHRHSSRSSHSKSMERQRLTGQDSFSKKEHKEEDRRGTTSKRHRPKHNQDDALQVVRNEFEEFQRIHHQETKRGHHYHRTHVLHQKGSKLQIETENVAKQQSYHREHNQHRHHHHQNQRKIELEENESTKTPVYQLEHNTSKPSPHIEYSSQNEHNAKLSARRLHVPNNSQSVRSSQKSHRERSNKMEMNSPRKSLKQQSNHNEGREKSAKEKKKISRKTRSEDPVYSLPPIMK